MPRRKPLTQEEWSIKQRTKIDEARNRRDEALRLKQEFEENNSDLTKAELKKVNKEYKNVTDKYEKASSAVNSQESNRLATAEGRQHAYPPDTAKGREIKAAYRKAGNATLEQVHLHHKLPKGMSAAFFNHASTLVNKGFAPEGFIEELARMAQKAGMEAGDIEQNMLPIKAGPHYAFHTEMRAQGSSLFPGLPLEAGKQEIETKLRKVKNPKDLKSLWSKFLKGDAKYLYREAGNWEPLDDLLKEISPEYTGKASLSKLSTRSRALKGMGKVAKAAPILGLGLGLGQAAAAASQGDYAGAAAHTAGAIVGEIPVFGDAAVETITGTGLADADVASNEAKVKETLKIGPEPVDLSPTGDKDFDAVAQPFLKMLNLR